MEINELNELTRFIRNELTSINTCYACEVVEVKNTRVRVKVLASDTKRFEFPEILDVPVINLKAGNSSITMPTTVSDIGLLFVSSKNTKRFKTGSGIFYKTDFDIDNSFYMGGLFDNSENEVAIDLTKLVIKKGSSVIELEDNEINIISGTINIEGGTVNLGTGGAGVARIGDTVEVIIPSGSSAGTYQGTIDSGSSKILAE